MTGFKIKEVEEAVTTGRALILSRRRNVPINVHLLHEAGYIEVEDVGEKLLYRWADQFPVTVRWEKSPETRVYNPNSIIHVQTKQKEVVCW